MNANELERALHRAFDYTSDNNRDVIGDTSCSMAEATEEITVRFCYEYLCAYIARNEEMIDAQLLSE